MKVVRDIMTPSVASIDQNSSAVEAAKLMQINNVGSIPVCDENGLLGMVTDRDIVLRTVATNCNPSTSKVGDIMTKGVVSVSPETRLRDAAMIMSDNQIRRIPVVEGKKLVGILSLGDLSTSGDCDTEVSDALCEISKP
ncbi:MAG: CBS domain-containing protein [Clostridiales bacterium]|nr:CBS domain-containing protein [Clostridiales bacterium]